MDITDITCGYRSGLIIKAYENWLKRGDLVLDVGCGNGVVAIKLQRHFKVNITGCDIMRYLKEDIPFVQMDKEDQLPFPNKSFDIAMFNDTLHHIRKERQRKLLEEALRVAKKVLIFDEKPTILAKIICFMANKIHNKDMDVPLAFRTTEGWIEVFKKLNLTFETAKIKRPLLYPLNHIAFQAMER